MTLTIHLGGRTIHIHNCYNAPQKLLISRNLATLQLLPLALDCPGEHLLVGDLNLHHPLWGRTMLPTQHPLADTLTETTAQSYLQLILPQGTVTWRSGRSMSTLDLSFATLWIIEQALQCRQCEELDSDSDHIPIIMSIGASVPQQAEPTGQPQWRKADWEQARERLEHRIGELSQECLGDSSGSDQRQTDELEALDKRVAKLQTTIQKTICDTIPLVRPSRWIRTGWSGRYGATNIHRASGGLEDLDGSGWAEAWWRGHKDRLSKLQLLLNSQARAITGLLKSTPVAFLQREACLPCAKELLDHRQTRYALRALSADGDHQTHQLLPASSRFGELHRHEGSDGPAIQHRLDEIREGTSVVRRLTCTADRHKRRIRHRIRIRAALQSCLICTGPINSKSRISRGAGEDTT